MGADEMLRVRRLDRLALRWQFARAWRQGISERRADHLGQVRALVGTRLDRVQPHSGRLVADSDLHLADGWTVSLHRSHVPTVNTLVSALQDGPVRLENVADHRRFFGLYFATCRGRLAMLVDDLAVHSDGGGLLRPLPGLLLV